MEPILEASIYLAIFTASYAFGTYTFYIYRELKDKEK